jgi:hypothetical protein
MPSRFSRHTSGGDRGGDAETSRSGGEVAFRHNLQKNLHSADGAHGFTEVPEKTSQKKAIVERRTISDIALQHFSRIGLDEGFRAMQMGLGRLDCR